MEKKYKTVWLDYCKSCNKKHKYSLAKCPGCGVHETPQPISDEVRFNCCESYICDGCEAYQDHY